MLYKREWMLYVLVFSVPFDRIPSFDIQDVTIRPSMILFGVAFLLLLFDIARKRVKVKLDKYWLWLLVYFLVMICSLFIAKDRTHSLMVIGFTGYIFVVFFVVSQLIKRCDLKLLMKSIIVAAVLTAIFGVYQYLGDVFGMSIAQTGLKQMYTKSVFGFPRIQSTMIEPLYYAGYLLLPIGILVMSRLRGFQVFSKWDRIITVLIGLVFALTLSRSAFLAAGVLVLVIFLWLGKNLDWKKIFSLFVDLILVLFLAYVLVALPNWVQKDSNRPITKNNPSTVKKFVSHAAETKDNSSLNRLSTNNIAYDLWTKSPLLGVGIGNYGFEANKIDPAVSIRQTVNNETLEILAETGILGLVSLIGFLIGMISKFISNRRNIITSKYYLISGVLVAALAATLVQYQFFSTLYITHIWVLLGIMAGLIGAMNAEVVKK